MASNIENSKNYVDVTKKYLKEHRIKYYELKDAEYFKDINGNIYYIDGKNVVLDYSEKEKNVALWLVKNIGGKIFMCPRINKPDGIKTPDYIWNGEKWDLKEITGKSKISVDNHLKKCRNQSNNFIIDNTKKRFSTKDLVKQIEKIYNNPKRKWIKKIILIENYSIKKVFTRNEKELTAAQDVPRPIP